MGYFHSGHHNKGMRDSCVEVSSSTLREQSKLRDELSGHVSVICDPFLFISLFHNSLSMFFSSQRAFFICFCFMRPSNVSVAWPSLLKYRLETAPGLKWYQPVDLSPLGHI